MKATIITKQFYVCPHCSEDSGSSFTHLIESAKKARDQKYPFGPWNCKRCKKPVKGVVHADGSVDVEAVSGGEEIKLRTLLVLPPLNKPLYLALNDSTRAESDGRINLDKDYFYGSHTCPTNWMDRVDEIFIGGTKDPHGLFLHVRSVVVTPEMEAQIDRDDFDDRDVFNEIQDQIIPWSDWAATDDYNMDAKFYPIDKTLKLESSVAVQREPRSDDLQVIEIQLDKPSALQSPLGRGILPFINQQH